MAVPWSMRRICVVLLHLSVWASVAPCAHSVEDSPADVCQHDDCEDSNLLALRMQRKAQSLSSETPSRKSKVGLAFQGGGWLSPADFVGVVGGLMAAQKRPLDWLFQEVRSLSADSGGNWFIQSISYSKRMMKVMEAIALKPSEAGNTYNMMITTPQLFGRKVSEPSTNYTYFADPSCQAGQKFFEALNNFLVSANEDTHGLASILAGATATFVEDLIVQKNLTGKGVQALKNSFLMLQAVLLQAWVANQGYFSWRKFVEFYYEQSFAIGPDTMLGSKPNRWAKGKILTAGVSFMTSTALSYPWPYKLGTNFGARPTQYITSTVAPAKHFAGGYVAPGLFSITMGQNGSQAPLPFCSNYTCAETLATYNLNQKSGFRWETGEKLPAKQTYGEFYSKNFYEVAGSIPVADVGAAASAFFGAMFTMSLPDGLPGVASACGFIPAPYVAEGKGGEAFRRGDELWLRSQNYSNLSTAVPQYAESNLHLLADGGSNDETGMAQALVAGNDEIVVFLEWNFGEESACSPGGDAYVLNQFGMNSNRSATDECVDETIANYVTNGYLSNPGYTLFETPSNSEVYDYIYNVSNDVGGRVVGYPPANSSRFLAYISTGTLPEATTASNPLWGIEGGRKVTVHFVTIATKADIDYGASTTLYEYGTLVQEVVDTLTAEANRPLVEAITQRLRGEGSRR